jgi:hypothetical protein
VPYDDAVDDDATVDVDCFGAGVDDVEVLELDDAGLVVDELEVVVLDAEVVVDVLELDVVVELAPGALAITVPFMYG